MSATSLHFVSFTTASRNEQNYVGSSEGSYAAPASSAYLYYTNEHKTWIALDKIDISAN
jgi:hypothetical protein